MKNLIILFAVQFLLSGFAFAQQKDLQTKRDDLQSDGYVGVALVIGNSAYQFATKLNSPVNDANDMAEAFRKLGFKVLKVRTNATLSEMEAAIAEFDREISANQGVGVFYYSGHGVQSKGINYLIPVDANIPTEAFLRQKAVDLESVMGTMEAATNKAKIVILDACRNDPFKGWRNKGDGEKGLAKVDAPDGMLIAFATSPKRTAADGLGRNSPYTEILLQEIVKPNISITDMLQNVRSNLATRYSQISWENTSLLGKFCFAGCNVENTAFQIQPTPQPTQVVNNNEVTRPNTSSAQTNSILTETNPDSTDSNSNEITNSIGMKFVKIQDVSFYIGKYEVTQEEWKKIMGKNPSKHKDCSKCPVENVSWNDVIKFIEKLNEKNDGEYRLPTEEEWYFAMRGDKETKFFWGEDVFQVEDYAWVGSNSNNMTHEVGLKKPNQFGLYDIIGNVWEWTVSDEDVITKGRVIKGASFMKQPYEGLNIHLMHPLTFRQENIGFRLVRNL